MRCMESYNVRSKITQNKTKKLNVSLSNFYSFEKLVLNRGAWHKHLHVIVFFKVNLGS